MGSGPDCARARFPEVAAGAPHYESFYLKACAPDGGLGLWLRYTVLKPPDATPTGALWCTLFDAAAPGAVAVKQSLGGDRLARPRDGYIQIGESLLTPGRADGSAAAGGPRRRRGHGRGPPRRAGRLARHGGAQLGGGARRALGVAARHLRRRRLAGRCRRPRVARPLAEPMARQRRAQPRRRQVPARRSGPLGRLAAASQPYDPARGDP